MNRILIVEDETNIARLIEMSLSRAGYECTVTVSYTHLDVYKRQSRHLARLARAPKNCISLPVWVAETQQQME